MLVPPDIRAEEEIVALDTTTGIAILYLLVVTEDSSLQGSAHRRSIMAVFYGLEGEHAHRLSSSLSNQIDG